MKTYTREQINAVPLTDKEQKSNEAFAFLAKVVKVYNEGWTPSRGDRGYTVYSKLLLWGGAAHYGSHCGLGYAFSDYAFSSSFALIGARLALRTPDLCELAMEEYKQDWLDLCMVDK